jgi:hypothetical protein
MTPSAIDSVYVGAFTLVNLADAVDNGAVRVTVRVEISVRTPAITDDRSPGLSPCIYNGLPSVIGSARNGNEKRFTRLALNTTKHPLPLNRVNFMIFAPTELALVDLDFIDRTAISIYTNMVFLQNWPQSAIVFGLKLCSFWITGRDAAHYVCENHNLLEGEITMLRP